MNEHTPGPWRESWDYQRISPDSDRVVGNACGPEHNCKGVPIVGSHLLQPDRETMQKIYADARLIAAAPDLLAALEYFLRADDGAETPDSYNGAARAASAAIAKATGVPHSSAVVTKGKP